MSHPQTTPNEQAIRDIAEWVRTNFPVDPARIYRTGHVIGFFDPETGEMIVTERSIATLPHPLP